MARPKKEKLIIYQVLMRLFGNANATCKQNGTIEENGCQKSQLSHLPVKCDMVHWLAATGFAD